MLIILCSQVFALVFPDVPRFECVFPTFPIETCRASPQGKALRWGDGGAARDTRRQIHRQGWIRRWMGGRDNMSVWWFGTCFICPYIGKNNPNWLICFRGVETTNQNCFFNYFKILKHPKMQFFTDWATGFFSLRRRQRLHVDIIYIYICIYVHYVYTYIYIYIYVSISYVYSVYIYTQYI